MADTILTQGLAGRFSVLAADSRTRWADRRRRRAAYVRTLHELRSLSDRDLADIGLGRSDIRRVALEAAELA